MRRSQCLEPRGLFGRYVLWSMNRRHAKVTDWGLAHVRIREQDAILDVGCGGGRTIGKLVAATRGMVCGIDHAQESVDAARRANRDAIERGQVRIERGSVTALPYPDGTFDLVTAIETHFWWNDLAGGMREILRVLKPGGRLLIVAEFYDGGRHARYAKRLAEYTGMSALSVAEHEAMFADAGFTDVAVEEDPAKRWLSAVGARPG